MYAETHACISTLHLQVVLELGVEVSGYSYICEHPKQLIGELITAGLKKKYILILFCTRIRGIHRYT